MQRVTPLAPVGVLQGPAVWSIPGVAHSPTIHNPFAGLATCKTPHYATAHQLLHRSFKQQGKVFACAPPDWTAAVCCKCSGFCCSICML